MKHKIGSKVYFYEFGHSGDKLLGVVVDVKENFDGSYTLEVVSGGDTWKMSSDFAYGIKG